MIPKRCHISYLPATLRCSGCKEVYYHDKKCQKKDWKKHKVICKYVQENPMCTLIEIKAGEGSGLSNRMINHIFDNKMDALNYMNQQDEFRNGMCSGPLPSDFCTLLEWDIEIYCTTRTNQLIGGEIGQGTIDIDGGHADTNNSAGIFLGCNIQSGFSRYNNMNGRIFVCGRNKNGKPMTCAVLWGILNFIWETMDLYGYDEPHPTIMKWARLYRDGVWDPNAGNGGYNIYDLDPYNDTRRSGHFTCKDHTSS